MIEEQINWPQVRCSIREVLEIAATKLKNAGVEQPIKDARILLGYSLDKPWERFYGKEREIIKSEQLHDYGQKVLRRCQREPVSRIIGRREFWNLELEITPFALDPRPDSETLIEAALDKFPDRRRPLNILDLGSGSGCLVLAALQEWPHSNGLGIDIDPHCVELAKANARRNGLSDRVKFQAGDWSNNLDEKFDIVLCNPPYIPTNDIFKLDEEVRFFEPKKALDGGPDGLDCYVQLSSQFRKLLTAHGLIFLEIGFHQKKQICEIMRISGLDVIGIKKDIGQRDRCLILSHKHC